MKVNKIIFKSNFAKLDLGMAAFHAAMPVLKNKENYYEKL